MKKIIFYLFIVITIHTKAQITFLHDYDSASTFASGGFEDQLMMVNFEVSGNQYVKINRHGQKICIYNVSHTLVQTINLSWFPKISVGNNAILYFSEHLFNLDSKKEFMYVSQMSSLYTTGIYNEDGVLLFSDTGAATIMSNIPLPQVFITHVD